MGSRRGIALNFFTGGERLNFLFRNLLLPVFLFFFFVVIFRCFDESNPGRKESAGLQSLKDGNVTDISARDRFSKARVDFFKSYFKRA